MAKGGATAGNRAVWRGASFHFLLASTGAPAPNASSPKQILSYMKHRRPTLLTTLAFGAITWAQPSTSFGQTAYNQAVRANNPTYYWTFDEAGLTNAVEQMTGSEADVFTPGLASEKALSTSTSGGVSLGQALALDRTATSVWNTGNLSGPAFTGAWAYEVWINSADPDQYNYILGSMGSNAEEGYNTGTIAQFSNFADAPGVPHIMLFTLFSAPNSFNSDSALQSGGWHHWVFVTKTPTQGTDVYQDGVLLGTYGNGSVIDAFPAAELRAGGWNANPSVENFTGLIDELAIYDLSSVADLSAKGLEIASHYTVGNLVSAPFRITNIARNPANGAFTLTWNSLPEQNYRLNYSPDLLNWNGIIEDNIASGGTSTTYGPFPASKDTGSKVFFRVTQK
jgi:hypothetical protein